MYGWHNKNTEKRNWEKLFPLVFSKSHHSFSFDDCNFNIQKDKETTGRIVVRREYNVINSFTLEASFWGPNIGRYQDCHFTPNQLRESGKYFCVALNKMDQDKIKIDLLNELQSSIIPSNTQIESILKEFDENPEEFKHEIEDDEELDRKAKLTELKLSRKGKRLNSECTS